MSRTPRTLAILIFLISTLSVQPAEPEFPQPLARAAAALDTSIRGWQWRGEDGQWQPYRTGQSLPGPEFDLRALPAAARVSAGFRVTGTPVDLDLNFRAAGLCRIQIVVNGRSFPDITVNGGDGTAREESTRLHLTKGNQPTEWEILVHVRNQGFLPPRGNPWPPRRKPADEPGRGFILQSAAFHYPAAKDSRAALTNWTQSLTTAWRLVEPDLRRFTFTGHPFSIPDNRGMPSRRLKRLQRALNKALEEFDTEALKQGDTPRLLASIRASLGHCGPLREYARQFEVYLIGNAHIDIAWLWRMGETVQVARNTFRTVLQNMKEYPELHYAQSQAVAYQWMEKQYPELFAAIRAAVQSGRWELVGGMWVEPDCNLISGESWVRQILYGKRYFRKHFGVDVTTGWNVDSFGYNWNMPQLFLKSGINRFVTQKIWWNDTTVFPYYVFWWQGADGSRLLSYFPPAGYTSRVRLDKVVNQITRYQATTGHTRSLILYGLGDHGGGPNREILDRVREYKSLSIAPRFVHSRATDFLKDLPRRIHGTIPVWKDELYLEYHRGTFTTQAAVKRANRELESRLGSSEKWAVLAHLAGADYPSERLEKAWKTVLTNQFHDILPGSSITPVYRDAAEAYARVRRDLDHVDRESLSRLCARIHTLDLPGRPLVVFNSLAWQRSGVVRLELDGDTPRLPSLLDHRGQAVPAEVVRDDWGTPVALLFVARDVPALGYRAYSLVSASAPEPPNKPVGGDSLENRFLKMRIDPVSGQIVSLVHKPSGREYVAPGKPMNVLEVYEDRPEDWDAWNIGYTGRHWTLDHADRVSPVQRTPVRQVVRVESSFLGLSKVRRGPTESYPSSFFVQEISLWDGLDRVDIHTRADWWEDHMMLKAAFPVNVKTDTATCEIPFAAIQRTTRRDTLERKARFEVPALRWVDMGDTAGGVSLLNDGKYGHDLRGSTIRLSLLRSPTWPDPLADRGRHSFTYSIYPHAGDWRDGATVHRGRELNTPMHAVFTDRHEGSGPLIQGFLQLDDSPVVLETLKRAEDEDALILRLYNSSDRPARTAILFPAAPDKVLETDLMETPRRTLGGIGPRLPLELGPFEILTLKVFPHVPASSR